MILKGEPDYENFRNDREREINKVRDGGIFIKIFSANITNEWTDCLKKIEREIESINEKKESFNGGE